MKKIFYFIVVLSLLIVNSVLASPIYPEIGDKISVSAYHTIDNVGEIAINILGTSSNPDYISFCVEHDVFINPGQTYTVLNISNLTDGIPPKALTPYTAYLYTMFVNNTLTGYTHNAYQAEALQKAIWYTQGERGGEYNNWVRLAEQSGWTTTGDVKILNLGSNVQDYLTIQPSTVPLPGTLVLFGTGLATLFGFRKKIKE